MSKSVEVPMSLMPQEIVDIAKHSPRAVIYQYAEGNEYSSDPATFYWMDTGDGRKFRFAVFEDGSIMYEDDDDDLFIETMDAQGIYILSNLDD